MKNPFKKKTPLEKAVYAFVEWRSIKRALVSATNTLRVKTSYLSPEDKSIYMDMIKDHLGDETHP